MTAIEKLEAWRDPKQWDAPPSEEDALRQLIFGAIADYLEEHAEVLGAWLRQGENDEMPDPSWVDRWADR